MRRAQGYRWRISLRDCRRHVLARGIHATPAADYPSCVSAAVLDTLSDAVKAELEVLLVVVGARDDRVREHRGTYTEGSGDKSGAPEQTQARSASRVNIEPLLICGAVLLPHVDRGEHDVQVMKFDFDASGHIDGEGEGLIGSCFDLE